MNPPKIVFYKAWIARGREGRGGRKREEKMERRGRSKIVSSLLMQP